MGGMVAAFRGVSSSWPKMCHFLYFTQDVFYPGRSWDGTTQVGSGTVKLPEFLPCFVPYNPNV